jgi:type II secretory pathway predicted ATPase ExeA
MYLEHFGLNEPPFRITPVTVFFFSGANRGEILDALIYSISEVEGIIKVSGEVGSGKTMLCRMLLEKLPDHIETIYLANPSLTREEMLYAIADGLGLNIKDERVGIIMQNIQNKLEEKAREGKRIVVLVDEAHAMPVETLEELRLLYNLQVGNAKLMQIVLFGQPELNTKLENPNMRQLKDRIAHHFHMQPLSRNILENYLMFRMRAAGYHGPNIFSSDAIKRIADASNGLMRRVNILADKSLLAAFVEDTHNIEARHVKAAMRDSELGTSSAASRNKILLSAAGLIVLLAGLVIWLLMDRLQTTPSPVAAPALSSSQPQPAVTHIKIASPQPALKPAPAPEKAATPIANPTGSLFEQRMAAGKILVEQKNAVASLQLFYSEEIRRERIEGFLQRARGLGKLTEIYLLPAQFGDKSGLRVLYGTYPSVKMAQAAIADLPTRYKDAFAASIYVF